MKNGDMYLRYVSPFFYGPASVCPLGFNIASIKKPQALDLADEEE